MKICFIVGTLGRGGAERQLIYMLQALQAAGMDIRVLCLTRGESYEKTIRDMGIEIEWVGKSNNRALRVLRIIDNLRKRRPDILQSCHFYTNIYAAIAGRALGIPSIGAVRSDLTSEIAANGFFGKWQMNLPHDLIANSKLAITRAIDRGVKPNKVHFVRNVVSLTRSNGASIPGNSSEVNILFAGRLVSQKNPELFVRLASRLINDLPEYKLNFQMAGDGPLCDQLRTLSAGLGILNGGLIFLGGQDDMTDIYRRADILVLTSDHEGTPNVILEAMSFGIPVVATSVGGVPDILTDKSGILVDPRDLDGLVDAATRLIRDPKLRLTLGRNGKDFVADTHSFNYLQKRLVEIYQGLLEKARYA